MLFWSNHVVLEHIPSGTRRLVQCVILVKSALMQMELALKPVSLVPTPLLGSRTAQNVRKDMPAQIQIRIQPLCSAVQAIIRLDCRQNVPHALLASEYKLYFLANVIGKQRLVEGVGNVNSGIIYSFLHGISNE